METTDQNIWDRLVTQIQGKMHLCPKLLQLVEDGTLEITREVKHDDCFSSFGPPALIIFFVAKTFIALTNDGCLLLAVPF